jgi:hypothetical protein
MRTFWLASVAIIVSAFVACGNPTNKSESGNAATALTAPTAVSAVSAGPSTRLVTMMDACDGPTFNAAIGPGTCSRNGGVPFAEFVDQLTKHQFVGAWHNAPAQTDAWLGDSLIARNNGGEVHTFTRVASYGGGVVPFLNDLSGTPNVAPECTTENDFVPPGGTDSENLNQTGELKFQCCIHPWMRTTVLVKSH